MAETLTGAGPIRLGKSGSARLGWLLALLAAPVLVVSAVILEIVGGTTANSPLPGWAHFVPLSWPAWGRVLWWLAVAVAALSFRLALRRVGLRTRLLVDVLTVAPFLAFAVGIVIGADWSTWH